MTLKCGKNKNVAHEAQSLMFLSHFDVLCDLLLNGRTATWNIFINLLNSNVFENGCIRIINSVMYIELEIPVNLG